MSGEWSHGPYSLFKELQCIEKDFGRNRAVERPKGPRTLDIDILLFGNYILSDTLLTVPHALLDERLFALLPLLELEPSLRDPRSGTRYAQVAAGLGDQGVYLAAQASYNPLKA